MRYVIRPRVCVVLVASLAASAWPLAAQTLVRRPEPPKPPARVNARAKAAIARNLVLPRGTSLQVEVSRQYPMKAGESIEGKLLYPLYADGRLAVAKNTMLRGKVVELEPDRKARIHGRLLGDFTPFRRPVVQFDSVELPGGIVPIRADKAADGAPVLQLSTPHTSRKKALLAREIAMAKATVRDRVEWFTAPGLKQRGLQVLYHQLPYHPQSIAAHTAWTFELKAPLQVSPAPAAAPEQAAAPQAPGQPEMWSVHALLTGAVTSAHAHPGDPVKALVVEPVYDRDKQVVVPQGAMLVGKVTTANAARSFGRNGKLRFTFQQVRFPEGYGQPVEGSLGGATTEKTQDLQMDAEGTVTPRNQASAIAPLLLTMLASRALDQDGNVTAQSGVASNGFGMVGRVVGLAAGDRNLAAGIGFYAAGLSFYDNFLRSGRDVVFPKDTRIEIETTPLRAPVLKPQGQ